MNINKIFLFIVLVSVIILSSCSDSSSYSNADNTLTSATYKDGEYTASATGYSGGLKVKVTIEDNMIKSIEIVSHNEVGKQYYEEAMATIPQAIINAQSTDVDAIAGATKTSEGIIKAVNKALEEARK